MANRNTEREIKNILEEGWLHRAMVFFDKPQEWAFWAVLGAGFLLATLLALAWAVLGAAQSTAGMGALTLLLFFTGDSLFLWFLPRRRISFGSWKSQAIVLAMPRTAVGLVVPPVALFWGWQTALLAHLALQLMGTLLLVYAAAVEPHRLSLTHLDVPMAGLPAGTPPVRLLHIGDIHLERLTAREQTLLSLVEDVRPDAILLTGDYVNLSYRNDETALSQLRDLLQRLHAPHGVYATLGSPPVDLRHRIAPLFEDVPACLMRDEWTVLDLGHGRRLLLLGLDCTHHLDQDAARLAQLVHSAQAATPNGAPRLLIYHSPELMPEAVRHGLDLYLCGHTHGGQVRLPIVGPILTSSQLGRRYVMGHYQEGRTHLYVSRGVGLEGLSAPRVRFLSPPEITLVTLRPAAHDGG